MLYRHLDSLLESGKRVFIEFIVKEDPEHLHIKIEIAIDSLLYVMESIRSYGEYVNKYIVFKGDLS